MNLYDRELYLLSLEHCLAYARKSAGVATLQTIEDAVLTIRAQYGVNPGSLTQSAIHEAITMVERLTFPAIESLRAVLSPPLQKSVFLPEITSNDTKHFLILAMEGALTVAHEAAQIDSLVDLETGVGNLRTAWQSDPDTLLEADLTTLYHIIQAAQPPSIYTIRTASRGLSKSPSFDGSFAFDGSVTFGGGA